MSTILNISMPLITKETTLERLQELIDDGMMPFSITNASLKDEYCIYGYDILRGPGEGDKIPKRTGSNIVHEDLTKAFEVLNLHLAILDDAFTALKNKPKNLEEVAAHALTPNFSVNGIRVSGSEESFSIILIGEKKVHHGEINLESPKVNGNSKYAYWEELKTAVERVRMEVILYMHGKANPQYVNGSLDFPKEADDNDEFKNPL